MVFVLLCCFVALFNKNVFLRTTSDCPVILDGQFSRTLIVCSTNGSYNIQWMAAASASSSSLWIKMFRYDHRQMADADNRYAMCA
jgi:hypothetical protein